MYLPGCDHAGISTQSVVENLLWRREKKTRHDLGRTALVERIWAWKDEYHERIRTVLRRMGGSFDVSFVSLIPRLQINQELVVVA